MPVPTAHSSCSSISPSLVVRPEKTVRLELLFVKHPPHCYHAHMSALIDNRKAHFRFEILETYEAGIELLGFEVKALRKGQGSLDGAHVVVRGGEAFLINMHSPPFQEKNTPKEYDSRRARRLLLSKKEIAKLGHAEGTKGLTMVPLSVYNKAHVLKLSLGIARGKSNVDKRETIKKRDAEREAHRALKGGE